MGLAVVGLWLELRGSVMSGRVLVVYFERGWPVWVEKLAAHSPAAWFNEALGQQRLTLAVRTRLATSLPFPNPPARPLPQLQT